MASKDTSLPQYTKGGMLVGTYLRGGGWGKKQDVFLVLAATVVFVKIQQSVLCVAGSIFTQQHTAKPTQVLDIIAVTYGSQLPSCCLTVDS
eukprot:9541352-Ditylum_brightwellii.AAC.1